MAQEVPNLSFIAQSPSARQSRKLQTYVL